MSMGHRKKFYHYLVNTLRVVFNGKRGMNGADAVFPPQMRRQEIFGKPLDGGKRGQLFADARHSLEDGVCDGVWRVRHAFSS